MWTGWATEVRDLPGRTQAVDPDTKSPVELGPMSLL